MNEAIRSPQTIVGLLVENVKKIKLVKLSPDGKTILITGANQQGKTSLVDGLWWAVGGKNAMRKTSEPIREGETEARAVVEFQDFTVERRITMKSSYLYVTLKDEAQTKISSPQDFLNKFLGTVSIDPTEILQMSPKEQVDVLLRLFKIYDKVTELDGKYEKAYQERWAIGQERDSAVGALDNLVKPAEGTPREEKSVIELSNKLKSAINYNQDLVNQKKYIQDTVEDITQLEKDIVSLEKELADKRNSVLELKKTIATENEKIKDKNPVATQPIEEEISKVEEFNNKVREAKKYDEFQAKVNSLNDNYKSKTQVCEGITKQKQEILQSVKMPVEGLTIDDRGLVFGPTRRPMEQLSDSEQHMIAGRIAMAEKPTIRILRIKHGESLDDKTFEMYQKMAEEHGYQLIVEKVDTSGKLGIVLEEGEVIAKNSQLTHSEVKDKQ